MKMNDTTTQTQKKSWWQRLTGGLKRSSSALGGAFAVLVT
jgi:fused signal recognition particle receptor